MHSRQAESDIHFEARMSLLSVTQSFMTSITIEYNHQTEPITSKTVRKTLNYNAWVSNYIYLTSD